MTTKTDEQERETFKRYYDALFDLSETTDTWGNPRFVHESVEAIWYGWKDRAAMQSQDREDAADMFWDADDTEDCLCAYDEETAVEQMVERAWPTDFQLHFTLQRAVRLPSLNIKVVSMSDCGTDIQYEREAIDHASRVEGADDA